MVRFHQHRIGALAAACFAAATILGSSRLLAADGDLPLERLDPPTRAKVLMTLLALVLLALGAMVCIWLGGRWARRIIHSGRRDRHTLDHLPSDWDTPGEAAAKER